MKVLLFSLLLATSLAQIGMNLGSSGDQTATISSSAQGNPDQLPSSPTPPTPPQAFSSTGVAATSEPDPIQPSSWNFLNQDSLGDGSKWIYPSANRVVYPLRWLVTYTIKFTTDCRKKPVNFKFSTTGSFFVIFNGNLISSWGRPYPNIATLTLDNLQCGCNEIKVIVYNYYFTSPGALVYSLSQDTSNCYTC